MNKEKKFRKKYPEFKDLISYDKECDTEFIAVGLIESVLDKHFARLHTTDFIKLKNKAEENGYNRAMQKVKKAIEKVSRNIPARFNDYYSAETVLKELLKELNLE